MKITTELIKELRDQTGISIMQCRKALNEAGGDKEKALIILRKKGIETAGKMAGRTPSAGIVQAYIHSNLKVGAMVELKSETDFVSNNPDFKSLAYEIAMHIAAQNPQYLRVDDIPKADMEKAREIFVKEAAGKPVNIREKIIEGKLASYFNEQVLLSQRFIKDDKRTIGNLIEEAIQRFGEKIEITKFVRLSI